MSDLPVTENPDPISTTSDPPAQPLANRSLTKYRLIVDEFGGWDALQQLLDALADVATARDATIANVPVATQSLCGSQLVVRRGN